MPHPKQLKIILKDVEPVQFIDGILKFKAEVQEAYASDTSSFFRDYIKYYSGKNTVCAYAVG